MNTRIFGVGLIGAGPVAQAIHLPTLLTMRDQFAVRAVMDIDEAVANEVAHRAGARAFTDAQQLIEDRSVDVVVIGTPNRFHAEQVIAACEAGKQAVVCEKPLAVSADEARSIAEVSARTGVPVIVGTMHAFDSAWLAGLEEWNERQTRAHYVRVSVVIPGNAYSEDFATEMFGRSAPPPRPPEGPDTAAAAITGGVMGLAIHDLPLVRHLLPQAVPEVLSASRIAPWGYEIVARVGDTVLELHGAVGASWDPSWTIEALAVDGDFKASFPLSYVHAGSAVAVVAHQDRRTSFGPTNDDGYQNEWEHVFRVLTTGEQPTALDELVADLEFALDLAVQSADIIRRKTAA